MAAAAAASSGGEFDAGKPNAEECAPFLDTEAKVISSATVRILLSHSLCSLAIASSDWVLHKVWQVLLHIIRKHYLPEGADFAACPAFMSTEGVEAAGLLISHHAWRAGHGILGPASHTLLEEKHRSHAAANRRRKLAKQCIWLL